jgi:membrane protein
MPINHLRAFNRLNVKKFKMLCVDIYLQMRDGEIQLVAASLSFSTILSLIPFFAVILATFQFFGGDDMLYNNVENLLLLYFKDAAGAQFTQVVKNSIHNIHSSAVGGAGAVFLIITSLRLMHDMEFGIHRVWNQKNTRPLVKRIFGYWFLMMVMPVALAIYAGTTTLLRIELGRGFIPGRFTAVSVLTFVLYLAYKYVPDLHVHKKSAFFSALLAAIGVVVVHGTFAWVVLRFFRLNNIYGSFAALPIFLIWVLTIWYVILGGVAICASTQRRQMLEKDLTSSV